MDDDALTSDQQYSYTDTGEEEADCVSYYSPSLSAAITREIFFSHPPVSAKERNCRRKSGDVPFVISRHKIIQS